MMRNLTASFFDCQEIPRNFFRRKILFVEKNEKRKNAKKFVVKNDERIRLDTK